MSRSSWILRSIGAVLGVLGIFLGSVLAYDRATEENPTYEPIRSPSAIDDWQPHWSPAEEPEVCSVLPRKWMMIGWDGADWGLILPLLERGVMPHLAALMRGGSYGSLSSLVPSLSPALWTTVATGVSPAEHGILRFYNKRPRLERWWGTLKNFGHYERHLYSNADRRVRAVWNELSDRDHTVLMVGYHNTFPVEEVRGMMVSNYLVHDSTGELMQMRSDGGVDSSFALGLVYPGDRLLEIMELQEEVEAGVFEALRRFVNLEGEEYESLIRRSRELDRDGDQRPYFLKRAYSFDASLAEAALRFLPVVQPDLMMVHFQGLDWAAHQFLYFHQPERFESMNWSTEVRRQLEEQMPAYRDTVRAFYRYQDEVLGRFLELRDSETAVMLLSDHGFGTGVDPAIPGNHDHGPPGILVLNGPGIRAGKRLEGASLYDILPTLMAGLELPVAQDLPGRVLRSAFCFEAWAASRHSTVPSYQTGEPFVPEVARPPELNRELIEQLESLGYLQ